MAETKPEESKKDKRIKAFVLSRKIKILMFLVKLFHTVVSSDQNVAQEVAGLR